MRIVKGDREYIHERETSMSTNYATVTALIPVDLVAHFYRWVAEAHNGATTLTEISAQHAAEVDRSDERISFPDVDPDLIRTWWAKLSDTARDVLAFLAHNADERFTGTELANECETLAGPSGAAGTFNWPSRHATNMGFDGPWHWDNEVHAYFMPATNAAVLLAAVVPSDD